MPGATLLDPEEMARAVADPVFFVEHVLGVSLARWPHQRALLECRSKAVTAKMGRRAGKTRTLAYRAAHLAFARPGSLGMIVSAIDDTAKLTIAELKGLIAGAPLLRGCTVDEFTREIRWANGSRTVAVPCSEARVRGPGADWLGVDEAARVPASVIHAALPMLATKAHGQAWFTSTPGGAPDHPFNWHFRRGVDDPGADYASFHFPSSASPLVDRKQLRVWERDYDPWFYRQEFLAEDVDDSEALFPDSLLTPAIAVGVTPLPPEAARRGRQLSQRWHGGMELLPMHSMVFGVDVGGSRDAHVVAGIGAVDDLGANTSQVYAVMVLDVLPGGTPVGQLLDRVIELCGCYHAVAVAIESSGVGFWPAQQLADRCMTEGVPATVRGVPTTAATKLQSFGALAGMLGNGSMVIPDGLPHVGQLLSEFRALGRTTLDGGGVRIAARSGHDDIPMAVSLAMRCVSGRQWPRPDDELHAAWAPDYPFYETDLGTKVPLDCRPRQDFWRGWKDPGAAA